MNTLYELTGQYMELLEWLEDADEVEEQTLKDTLDGLEGELETKAEHYAVIIRELSNEALKFEEEKKRLEARQKTLENRVNALKDHLFLTMKTTGKTKFKSGTFSFAVQKNGGMQPMEILPDAEIPDEYTRKEPDSKKIRDALKEGKELPFAVLKERGEHLSIR